MFQEMNWLNDQLAGRPSDRHAERNIIGKLDSWPDG